MTSAPPPAIQKKTSGDIGHIGRSLNSCSIGVDDKGKEHVWHRGGNSVVVADADGVEHRQYLGDDSLLKWRNYVQEKRGWERMGPLAAAAIRADHVRKQEGRR